jgi:hypothetical protein
MRIRTHAEGAHTDYKSARAIRNYRQINDFWIASCLAMTHAEGAHTDYKSARAIRNHQQINDFWIASCLAMTDAEGLREITIFADFCILENTSLAILCNSIVGYLIPNRLLQPVRIQQITQPVQKPHFYLIFLTKQPQ